MSPTELQALILELLFYPFLGGLFMVYYFDLCDEMNKAAKWH